MKAFVGAFSCHLFLETFHVERWLYYMQLYFSSSNSWSQHHLLNGSGYEAECLM
jgi:hypothetical protein